MTTKSKVLIDTLEMALKNRCTKQGYDNHYSYSLGYVLSVLQQVVENNQEAQDYIKTHIKGIIKENGE